MRATTDEQSLRVSVFRQYFRQTGCLTVAGAE